MLSEASRKWGKALGLVETQTDASSITLSFSRYARYWQGLEIKVNVSREKKGQTLVAFYPTMRAVNPSVTQDAQRMAERFASRVCSDLASQGASVTPEDLGKRPEDAERYRRRTRFTLVLYWGLLWLIIPGTAVGALLAKPWWEGAIMVPVWIIVLTRWGIYARFRFLGARSRLMYWIWVMGCAFAVMATLIFVFLPPIGPTG